MTFTPKLFRESGATEGSGGATETTTTETQEASQTQEQQQSQAAQEEIKTEVQQPIITEDELKSYGFDSKEAFKTFLAKQKDENISPEEKLEKENIAKANFLKFSAENKLLKVEEYNQFENLKSKADRDLVYEKFLTSYKEEHPEITDEKELEEAAKEDFDYEYKLKDGLSETAKNKGLEKLAKEAKELRSPFENKILKAQEEFKTYNNIKETYPKFEKFVDEAITRNTPDKLAVVKVKDGDTEIPIEIELTKEDREAMAKSFKTEKTFALFADGKPEDIQKAIDNKMQGWLIKNKQEAIVSKTFELGKGIGLKQGSTVGAENPFALKQQQGGAAEQTGEKTREQSQAEIAQARQQYKQGR